jgi:hypothetical protein
MVMMTIVAVVFVSKMRYLLHRYQRNESPNDGKISMENMIDDIDLVLVNELALQNIFVH